MAACADSPRRRFCRVYDFLLALTRMGINKAGGSVYILLGYGKTAAQWGLDRLDHNGLCLYSD